MRYSFPKQTHSKIFGQSLEDTSVGRQRLCRVCGGWHKAGQIPHNCRPPQRQMQHLAAPQLAPSFETFTTGGVDNEVIGSRNDKREYMARTGLVEHEKGIRNENAQWVRERENADEIGQTIKRFMDTDKEYWTPEERGETARTEELSTDGQDVDLSTVEVADGTT